MRTVDLREQEIFLEALEIPSPVARLDYIYQACGDNISLRDRVSDLLDLQVTNDFILDKEIVLDKEGNITSDQEAVADLIGQTIGKYHLVRLLGSGGMGDVYLAEQKEPIRRRVAVKVIKLGLDTKNFIRRFAAERQALAVMDHEGITKVFDAGSTKTGRPFFVMELVSGDPITKFCDEYRLDVESRLAIFGKLCKAIQHAHQKGLIHRDLKPSNILVNKKEGEFFSKVIDFGVSKATHGRVAGQTDLTRMACMIGTPEYMSPEQTDTQGFDQDIRTDIYSLGAILYELLTGSTPFELEDLKSKNLFSIREIVQTRAVESPSSRINRIVDKKPQVFRDRDRTHPELQSELKGNLDAIALKCLQKDRNLRYATVAELLADLERHSAGDPIAIVRHSPIYYYGRLFNKHKWAVLISAVVAFALISVSVFSLISAGKANRFAEQMAEAETLAKSRLNELAVARRDAQIEKSKSRSFENKYIELAEMQKHEEALLNAIAKFNLLRADDAELFVSRWLRSRYPEKISNLLPSDKFVETTKGDIALMTLIVAEQRKMLGHSHEKVAETLDLLGEKYLNARQEKMAVDVLRQSLLIHTENDNDSEARLRTMILLARALKRVGNEIEFDSFVVTIRRNLEKFDENSRLHQMMKDLESQ